MRIIFICLLVVGGVVNCFSQNNCELNSPSFCTVSDSLLDHMWQNCLMLEPIETTALESEAKLKGSVSSQLNLQIGEQLEFVFGAQNFVYGLSAEAVNKNATRLEILAEEAEQEQLHHTSIWTLYFAQMIYQYSFQNDKALKVGDKAIAYYNSLPQAIQSEVKNKAHRLAELYHTNLGIKLNEQQFDAAQQYFKGALHWGKQSYQEDSVVVMYARPLQKIAQYYTYTDQVDSAVHYLDIAIEATKLDNHQQMLVSLYFSKGEAYNRIEAYDKALEPILNALDLSHEMQWQAGVILALSAISDIHESLGNAKKSMEYAKEILIYYHENPQIQMEMQGTVFERIAQYFNYENQIDSAIFYQKKCLEVNQALQSVEQVVLTHMALSDLYASQGDSSKMKDHLTQAADIGLSLDWEGRNIASILGKLGEHSLSVGQYQNAITYATKAHRIATDINMVAAEKELAIDILCKAYLGVGQVDSVHKYLQLWEEVKEDAFRLAQDSVVLGMQEKYETKEKEQEIAQLNEKNIIIQQRNNLYIGLVVLALLVIGLVIYFYYRQKRTSELLQNLQATKDKLFSIIAHDLRTPFNALMNFSKKIEKDIKNKDVTQLEASLSSIHESSSSAYYMFEDLLGWTKAQTGQLSFEAKDLSLYDLVNDSLGILKGMIEFKNIKVEVDLEVPAVHGDAYMLRTVLRNLMTNSLKYLDNGGAMKIKSTNKNGQVQVQIEDDGSGIDAQTLERILNKEDGKDGLGMVLCQEFVESNGGTFSMKSTLGNGTTALFTLPQAKTTVVPTNITAATIDNSVSIPQLSEEVKQQIQPVVEELVGCKVYFTSKIRNTIQPLELIEEEQLQQWLKLLRKSTESINEELYLDLLKEAQLSSKK